MASARRPLSEALLGAQSPGASILNVVDSCGWLEYFGNGKNAPFFAKPLEDEAHLLVPALCMYEVCKRVLVLHGESAAGEAHAVMRRARFVQLDADQLLAAARASATHQLSMGDAIIWHTAQIHGAALYTQDAGMRALAGVRFVDKG